LHQIGDTGLIGIFQPETGTAKELKAYPTRGMAIMPA
jgi:hypothetical protein